MIIITYQWDPLKNKLNYEKHGLRFEEAELVLNGRTVSFLDDRRDYGETRYITLGELVARVVVVIHTQRNETIRIISMRKANEREQKTYFQRLKENRPDERSRYRLF